QRALQRCVRTDPLVELAIRGFPVGPAGEDMCQVPFEARGNLRTIAKQRCWRRSRRGGRIHRKSIAQVPSNEQWAAAQFRGSSVLSSAQVMRPVRRLHRYTYADYVALELQSPTKHEF